MMICFIKKIRNKKVEGLLGYRIVPSIFARLRYNKKYGHWLVG